MDGAGEGARQNSLLPSAGNNLIEQAGLRLELLVRELHRSEQTHHPHLHEGINATISVHLRLIRDEAFLSGDYDTGYLERLLLGEEG